MLINENICTKLYLLKLSITHLARGFPMFIQHQYRRNNVLSILMTGQISKPYFI